MPLRDKAEPFVVAALGAVLGEPISAVGGLVKLGSLLLPVPGLRERAEQLVKRMEAHLPDDVEVLDWEVSATQRVAVEHVSAVDDLAASGGDAEAAARLAMERGEAHIATFKDGPREHVLLLLTAYLGALRADPEIVRDVQTRLQVLTLDEVRRLGARLDEQMERTTPPVVFTRWSDLDTATGGAEPLPSQLLDATYEVVPFYGRERELDLFRQFRERTFENGDLGTVVIQGEGGLGKTRLGMEAVRRARDDGWEADFLGPSVTPDLLWAGLRALDARGKPVFVVADYGEDRPEQLATMIRTWRATPAPHARRLVLLVRQKGLLDQRLDEVARRDASLRPAADYLRGAQVQPLTASDLRVPVDERETVFLTARRSFAARLGRPVDGLPAPPDSLTKTTREYDHLGLPLYLHMAALASLDGRATVRKRDLLAVVLDRNWAYVERLLDDVPALDALHLTKDDLHDVLTVATLALAARPSSEGAPDAGACLAPTPLGEEAPPRARRQLAAFLTDTFGTDDAERGHGLDALRPDALGEGLVFETLGQTPGLLETVLAMDEGTRQSACTVLVRAALALADDPERWLTSHLNLERLRSDVRLARTLLVAIPGATVALAPLAAVLAETVVRDVDPDDEIAEALRASRLDSLGIRLSAVGRRDDALAATEEAVAIYRRLAEAAPDAFEPDLARSLSNLGADYSGVGRRDDALAATEEAVAIYRRLAEAAPDAFEPDLAGSLSNLGDRQMETDDPTIAVASYTESLRLLVRFVQAHPEAFRGLTMATVHDYRRACEATETEPDGVLLAPLIEALGLKPPAEGDG